MTRDEVIERFADLQHEQWSHWMRYMLDNFTPGNLARWRMQMDTPYAELSETEKRSDRNWAKKHIDLLQPGDDMGNGLVVIEHDMEKEPVSHTAHKIRTQRVKSEMKRRGEWTE